MKYFISENLKFLRSLIGISIERFSQLAKVDAERVFLFEDNETEISFSEIQDLAKMADYFALPLDVLLLDDIEKKGLLENDHLDSLKAELEGVPFDRQKFIDNIMYAENDPIGDTDEEIKLRSARKTLSQIDKGRRLESSNYSLINERN